MAQGCITSSTILANGPAFDNAILRIRDYPQCSIGVHLNLTEFRPLVAGGLFPILDGEGCFAGGRIRHIPIGGQLREAIFQEWCAQIERLASLGLRPSHIDSHHHVHTIPALFPVLKRVQRRFGLRKVRITMNIYPPDSTKTSQDGLEGHLEFGAKRLLSYCYLFRFHQSVRILRSRAATTPPAPLR